jgi:hypothetical protein
MHTPRFDEALPLLEDSVPLLERAMGPAHPNVESVRQMLKRAKEGAEAQRQAGHSMQEGAGAEEEVGGLVLMWAAGCMRQKRWGASSC